MFSLLIFTTTITTSANIYPTEKIMDYFISHDIKIFLSSYAHIHLALNLTKDEDINNDKSKVKNDFIAVSKYYGSGNFQYNDIAKINKDGDKYSIKIGDSPICVDSKNNINVCEDKQQHTLFEFKRSKNGFLISNEKKCITKGEFFDIKMAKCDMNDGQIFDFKNKVDLNVCKNLMNNEDDNGNKDSSRSINSQSFKISEKSSDKLDFEDERHSSDIKHLRDTIDDKPIGVEKINVGKNEPENVKNNYKPRISDGFDGIYKLKLQDSEIKEVNKLYEDPNTIISIKNEKFHAHENKSKMNNEEKHEHSTKKYYDDHLNTIELKPIKDLSELNKYG